MPVLQNPAQLNVAPESQGAPQSNVSPEEQEAYNKVVMAGMKILFENEKTKNGIEKQLKSGADKPAEILAEVAATIILQLDEQSKGQIPETVIIPAATEILEQVRDLADSLNIFPIDKAVENKAAQLMNAILMEQYGTTPEQMNDVMGQVDPEELQRIQLEQEGTVNQQPPVTPGVV